MAKKIRTRLIINPESIPFIRFPRFGRPAFVSPGGTFPLVVRDKPDKKSGMLKLIHPDTLAVFAAAWELTDDVPDEQQYTHAAAVMTVTVPDGIPAQTYDISIEQSLGNWDVAHRCLKVWHADPVTMRLAHISNINFNNPAVETLSPELIAEINLWNPDLVYVSGDLCEWDFSRKWRDFFYVLAYLKQLRGPVVMSMGNHENPDLFESEVGKDAFYCEMGAFHFLLPRNTTPAEYQQDAMAQAWMLTALEYLEEHNGIGVILAHDGGTVFMQSPGYTHLLEAGVRMILSGAHKDLDPKRISLLTPDSDEIDLNTTHQSSQVTRQGADGHPRYRIVEWDGAQFKSDYQPESPMDTWISPPRRRYSIPVGNLHTEIREMGGNGIDITIENRLKRGISGARVDVRLPAIQGDISVRGGTVIRESLLPIGSHETLVPILLNVPEGGFVRVNVNDTDAAPRPIAELSLSGPKRAHFGIPFELTVTGTIHEPHSTTAILIVAAQRHYKRIDLVIPKSGRFEKTIPWTLNGIHSRRIAIAAYLHSDPIPVFHELVAEPAAQVRTSLKTDDNRLRLICRLNSKNTLPDDTRWTLAGVAADVAPINMPIETSFPLKDDGILEQRVEAVLIGDKWHSRLLSQPVLLRVMSAPSSGECEMYLLDDDTGLRAFPETIVKVHRLSRSRLHIHVECLELNHERMIGPGFDNDSELPIHQQESLNIYLLHAATGWGRHILVSAAGEWMLSSVDLDGNDYGSPSGEHYRVQTSLLSDRPGWLAKITVPLPGKSIYPQIGRAILDFQIGRHRSADGSLQSIMPTQGVFRDRDAWGKLVL